MDQTLLFVTLVEIYTKITKQNVAHILRRLGMLSVQLNLKKIKIKKGGDFPRAQTGLGAELPLSLCL